MLEEYRTMFINQKRVMDPDSLSKVMFLYGMLAPQICESTKRKDCLYFIDSLVNSKNFSDAKLIEMVMTLYGKPAEQVISKAEPGEVDVAEVEDLQPKEM